MPSTSQIASMNGAAPAYSAPPGSPVAGYPVPGNGGGGGIISQQASTQATAASNSDTAPAISWVAVLAVLVLIRVAYERGIRGSQL